MSERMINALNMIYEKVETVRDLLEDHSGGCTNDDSDRLVTEALKHLDSAMDCILEAMGEENRVV